MNLLSVPDQPKSIVYIRPDTIGDLVIFTSALIQLQNLWPNTRHILLVRPGYESLAPLFPPSVVWKVAPINPFKDQPGASRDQLESILRELESLEPDTIVAATLNRTWLEVAIAAHFPNARRVALGQAAVDTHFAARLKLELGVDAETAFNEVVLTEPGALDWECNHRLADQLVGQSVLRTFPHLEVPPGAHEGAQRVLQARGLLPGGFAAVFPGGVANVPIKAWPYSHFGELIRWLENDRQIPVLVLAHESESAIVNEVVSNLRTAGGREPAVWLGRDGEIPLLAALLSQATFYVGHDTGAMHIAAAVDRPVIGIFGGGHWPRFRPAGRKTGSVVQPLPCFGCNWDCRFGDAPCVKKITTADVTQAVERLLSHSGAEWNQVLEVQHFSPESLRLIDAVTVRYGRLQMDRIERQHRIEELKREADIKDTEIVALKQETDHKDDEINNLKSESDTKDGEISTLKAVCNEREALIIKLDGHIKEFQRIIPQLNEQIAAKSQALTANETELQRINTILARLPPDAEQWGEQFALKDQHIRNLENYQKSLLAEVSDLRHSITNYSRGHISLEQSKHYGKLLAEKEAVIQTLRLACKEREAVIQKIALETAQPLGRIQKLVALTRDHIRLKWGAPLDDWLFKKVVEEYWMQIGVLQHYPPRPIKWDVLPKKSIRDEDLPKIGIVTPSYGQATFVESTMLSVLNQQYPKLYYVVQDGASKDASPEIISRYASRLHHWESAPDRGQADAIRKGFDHLDRALSPTDIMAWLNSDDFITPRALHYVGEYFARNPEVDVVYGHRIIIDPHDHEIGRWIMPRHDPRTLEWIDYVPQETVFWRKRIWDLVGGIDPSFQFALDWDLLARFQQAKAKIVRLPYFLGCFRVHPEQKTSQHIHTVGMEEMVKIRTRFHGPRHNDFEMIEKYARKARFSGALNARLVAMGVRY